MIGEERSPRLGWQLGMADMYLATDAWEIVMPSFQEFAVNSRRSPNRVVTTHGSNQITRLARNTGTLRPAVTNLPSPVPLKSLTMPTTVSGLTMIRAERQSDHKGESQTQRHRSARPRTSRFVF